MNSFENSILNALHTKDIINNNDNDNDKDHHYNNDDKNNEMLEMKN